MAYLRPMCVVVVNTAILEHFLSVSFNVFWRWAICVARVALVVNLPA